MTFRSRYITGPDLVEYGFRSVGEDVLIDSTAIIVGAQNISIGSHVRIDAFTSLICSADDDFAIGSYVHIGAYSYIAASHGVLIDDFAALSQGCRLYSASDDYSGESMTNPTVPESLRNVESGLVHIRRHAIIGSGSVVMPGVSIGEGTAVGALSFVNRSLDPWTIYFGSPVRRLGPRSQRAAAIEREALAKGLIRPHPRACDRINQAETG